jgi:hypothetical protein
MAIITPIDFVISQDSGDTSAQYPGAVYGYPGLVNYRVSKTQSLPPSSPNDMINMADILNRINDLNNPATNWTSDINASKLMCMTNKDKMHHYHNKNLFCMGSNCIQTTSTSSHLITENGQITIALASLSSYLVGKNLQSVISTNTDTDNANTLCFLELNDTTGATNLVITDGLSSSLSTFVSRVRTNPILLIALTTNDDKTSYNMVCVDKNNNMYCSDAYHDI